MGAIRGESYGIAWTRIFQLSFLIGLFGGFIIYCIICKLSPVPGAGVYEPWVEPVAASGARGDEEFLDGVSVDEKRPERHDVNEKEVNA